MKIKRLMHDPAMHLPRQRRLVAPGLGDSQHAESPPGRNAGLVVMGSPRGPPQDFEPTLHSVVPGATWWTGWSGRG